MRFRAWATSIALTLLICGFSPRQARANDPSADANNAAGDYRALIETQLGVRIDEDVASFSDSELSQVYSVLKTGPLSAFPQIATFQILAKKRELGAQDLEYGDYDENSRTIEIVDQAPHFLATFIHEFFHALRFDLPSAFLSFERIAGWSDHAQGDETIFTFEAKDPQSGLLTHYDFSDYELDEQADRVVAQLNYPVFPSDYSKLGPEEMFAECGAATTLALMGQGSDLYRLDRFEQTDVYAWMVTFIRSGGKV